MGGTKTQQLAFQGATLPKTNSEFTPENGWLEDDPFLLGQKRPIFRAEIAVSFMEGRV